MEEERKEPPLEKTELDIFCEHIQRFKEGNQEERENSDTFLVHFIQNDKETLITLCTLILSNPELEQHKNMALILLKEAFASSNKNASKLMKDLSTKDENLINTLKSLLIEHIGHPNETIRNLSASFISVLISIEKDWNELAKSLITLLQCAVNELDQILVVGVLTTFNEILLIRGINSDEYNTEDIIQILYQLGSQITSLFPIPDVPYEIRFNSIKCLCHLFKAFSNLFKPQSEIDVIITQIGTALPTLVESSLQTELICQLIIDLLFTITTTHYEESPIFFERICDLINFYTSNFNDIRCYYAIEFWESLAQFELPLFLDDKKRNSVKANSEQKCRDLILFDSFSRYDMLLQMLYVMSTDDENIEDLNNREIHMIAQSSLRAMFVFDPENLLPRIKRFVIDNFAEESWVNKHAAILAITCCCTRTYIPEVEQFIIGIFEYVKECALMSPPRLAETALWALSMMLRVYGNFMHNLDNFKNMYLFISPILYDVAAPNIIMKRCCTIFYHMCKNADPQTLDYYLEDIKQSMTERIWYQIRERNDLEYIQYMYEALNSMIDNVSQVSFPILQRWLIEEDFNLIAQLQVCSHYIVRASICSHISKIAKRLGKLMIDFSDFLMGQLIGILNDKEYILWQEVFIAIALVIRGVGNNSISFIPLIIDKVSEALMTYDPNMIRHCACLITDIFTIIRDSMLGEYANSVINMFFKVIKNSNDTINAAFISDVVCALTTILGAQYKFVSEDLSDKILTLLIELSTPNNILAVSGDNSTTHFPMISTVVKGYYSIFAGCNNTPFLQRLCDFIFPFIESVQRNGYYDPALLYDIYALLYQIGVKLKEKANVRLNKRYVKQLVNNGINNMDDLKLQEMAKYVKQFLEQL